MSKNIAIVTFLDHNTPNLLTDLKYLHKSFMYSMAFTVADLIVFAPKTMKPHLPCNAIHIEYDGYPLESKFGDYRYLNSISLFNHFPASQLEEYKYILKTDLDVFLTPHFIGFQPDQIMTGTGGYSNTEVVKDNCMKISKELGLRHRGIHNVGSTLYGPAKEIVNICQLATRISEYLLENIFNDNEGSWPCWFKGVTSMYATEIAINHLSDNFRITKQLDARSDSNESVNDVSHIHSWHTSNDFSKHKHYLNEYADLSSSNYSPTASQKEYCMHIALLSLESPYQARGK